ncbi:MAG: hypothetical protein FD123_2770 [Bacteroidetes bacterium]|nr:MAG: hypothetical protein FD123_2770 [Bacteroidota bacterium]
MKALIFLSCFSLFLSCATTKSFKRHTGSPVTFDVFENRVEVRLLDSKRCAKRYAAKYRYIKIHRMDSAQAGLSVKTGGSFSGEETFYRTRSEYVRYELSKEKKDSVFLPLEIKWSW